MAFCYLSQNSSIDNVSCWTFEQKHNMFMCLLFYALYKYQKYFSLSSINIIVITIFIIEVVKSCSTYLQSTLKIASIWYQRRTLMSSFQDSICRGQRDTSKNSIIKFISYKQQTYFKGQRKKLYQAELNRTGRLYSRQFQWGSILLQ